MKKVLIIKTGSTECEPEIAKLGDFENWIIGGIGVEADNFIIVDPTKDEAMPILDSISGIIITGSPTMITTTPEWLESLSVWIENAAKYNIPMLGICFGHQLLALTFGGEVGYNHNGTEVGTVDIHIKNAGISNKLFEGANTTEKFHVIHSQSVLELPEHAERLASNKFEENHCFVINNNIWGVQFHPEFNSEIMSVVAEVMKSDLEEENIDFNDVLNKISVSQFSSQLLKNFYNIIIKE